jgi:hypothetical protein
MPPSKGKNQLVFIDDSGDPSFSLNKGATAKFVIACIIFDDTLVAEETAVAIKKYRRKIGFPDDVEFKFSKSKPKVKKGFLETIAGFDFRIRCIVVDKSVINGPELKRNEDSFYNYFVKQVLLHNKGTLVNARIRLDGHGNRFFRRNLTSYLRRELNGSRTIIKNLRLVNSKKDGLIQMADMIAGAIRRSYDEGKKSNKKYRQIVNKKIEDCWEFK